VVWEPNRGPQYRFLASAVHEVLYGGAAGGGKSQALIAYPLRWTSNQNFHALILRRTTPQLLDLLQKAAVIYPRFDGRPKSMGAGVMWKFPSGATIWFNHCQHEDDAGNYDGHEFQFVGFDELPHFTRKQYTRIRARIRSAHKGLPRYTRNTANPPDSADGLWVFEHYAAWLDPAYKTDGLPERKSPEGKPLPPAAPEQILWFLKEEGSEVEKLVPPHTKGALSRTFIPAKLSDNPHIGQEYLGNLNQLDPVRRQQLRDGNWEIRPKGGNYFQRSWFKLISQGEVPGDVFKTVRRWDIASTRPTSEHSNPDWTRGVKMSRTKGGLYIVRDMRSLRDGPAGVEALIKRTAVADGRTCHINIPQDPAAAGKIVLANYRQLLAGWPVSGQPETGDKEDRARPFSAQVEAGNILVVAAPWNEEFFNELESFPVGGHDDIVDAADGAYNFLTPSEGAARFLALSKLTDDDEEKK
jgi:predicted phage terminase large subunit-like protein